MVAAPITTGDTAFRSARLIIAQAFRLSQRKKINRIYICVPVFAVSLALLVWQIQNPDGFNTIWKYFGWANQTLAVFTLWTLTVYLAQEKKAYVLTLVPALFIDRRLYILPHGEQYCFRLASCRGLCYWRRRGTGYCSVVHGVAEEDACWGQGVMQPMVHRVALRC